MDFDGQCLVRAKANKSGMTASGGETDIRPNADAAMF